MKFKNNKRSLSVMFTKRIRLITLVLMSLMASLLKNGWAVDPYDNWPNPQGGYVVDYPLSYTADQITDKDGKPLVSDLNLKSYGNVFRYVYYRSNNVRYPWLVNFLLPVKKNEIRDPYTREIDRDSGIGDARFSTGFWVVNNKEKNLYIGPGIDVDMPTGHYDQNNFASVGENIWRFRPTIVLAKFSPPFDVELTGRYSLETPNQDTNNKKGDLFIFESYTGMFLNKTVMVGGHFNLFKGRDDHKNGDRVPDTARQWLQAGPNVQWMITERVNVMGECIWDFNAKNTTEGRLLIGRLVWKI